MSIICATCLRCGHDGTISPETATKMRSEPERYARISVPLHKVSGVREQGCEVGAKKRSRDG